MGATTGEDVGCLPVSVSPGPGARSADCHLVHNSYPHRVHSRHLHGYSLPVCGHDPVASGNLIVWAAPQTMLPTPSARPRSCLPAPWAGHLAFIRYDP